MGARLRIYQHEAPGADKAITEAIDAYVDDEAAGDGDDEGIAVVLVSAV